MKTILKLIFLILLIACSKRKEIPIHTNVFKYFDNKTQDTIKYYGFKNLDTAIYYAKKQKKNILVIFSADYYSSNYLPEWRTLSTYSDKEKIENNFIIVWLSVANKALASDTNQVVFWFGKNRKLTQIGDQNKYFEEHTFKYSSQPLLSFIDTLKKPYGKIIGYNLDKKTVENFINSGLKNN